MPNANGANAVHLSLLAALTAGALFAFAPSASAAGPSVAPSRAAGLWELKHIGGGGTVIGTQTYCVSAASEAKLNVFGQIALNVNCSKYVTSQAGDTWSFEFVCGPAQMSSTTKGKVSGDFAASYTVQMTESDDSMELSRTIQARHKGACPAGVAPGTLRDETGNVIARPEN